MFTHDLPPTSMVFVSIFANGLKYFVAGPNLSIITTKQRQSMDDLAVCANQWRMGMDVGKTSKLLFRCSSRYIPDWHITLHGKAIRSVTSVKFLGITFDTTLSFTKNFHAITTLARHRLLKLLSLSTSTHGPSPFTTIRLFNTYICTLLEYGSAATCVANPSRFVQWERLQMRLITKTLDLPITLNHHILKRHADQPTIHDILLYLSKRWYGKAYENNAAHRDFIHNHTHYYAGKRRRIPDEILKQWSIFSFLLVPLPQRLLTVGKCFKFKTTECKFYWLIFMIKWLASIRFSSCIRFSICFWWCFEWKKMLKFVCLFSFN